MAAAQTQRESPMLLAALAYAQRGWRVFPLSTTKKVPLIAKVRGGSGCRDATVDIQKIRAWWTQYPQANIGWAMGKGYVAIDEDTYKGADISAWRLPPTLQTRSANGGKHHIYHYAGDLPNVSENLMAPGVCIKADGGYVVAPPSRFPGKSYQFVDPHQPVAELPERIAELIRNYRKQRALEQTGPEERQRPQASPRDRGQEDAGAHWLAWAMQKTGMGQGHLVGYELAQQLLIAQHNGANVDVDGVLMDYARQATLVPSDPFTERDVDVWKRSAAGSDLVRRAEPARSRAARGEKRSAPRERNAPKSEKSEPPREQTVTDEAQADEAPADEAAKFEHRTDMGNARRFVRKYGATVRYVALWGHWMTWDGRRWQHDWNGRAHQLAKATVRDIYKEAADADDDERRDLVKWAMKSESRERLVAMLAVAQSEPELARLSEQFDTRPWLLTVQNGTLDLRTGKLGPHDPAHGITRLAPVAYDPQAQCPTWLRFLDRIMAGNAQLITFLQRAVGYSLTDDTSAQVMFLLHGTGANGKSRFLEAIEGVLGEYGMSTPTSTLMAKRDNNIPNDVARLKGARFVKAIETEEGNALAESLVKQMTGGDMITARFMRGEWFDFKPTFKLWLAANHLPTIRGTDDGIWRRIRYIPFEVQIPDAERDAQLGEKLRAEYPGILAWAVRGCLDWQREGLGYPEAVQKASESYRARMDNIGQFLKEMTEPHPTLSVGASRLYSAYESWCQENADRPRTQTRFGLYLSEHGYLKSRTSQGVFWTGLRFKTVPGTDVKPEGGLL